MAAVQAGPSGDRAADPAETELAHAVKLLKLSPYHDSVFTECGGQLSQTFRNAAMAFERRDEGQAVRADKLYAPGLEYLAKKKGAEYDRLVAYFKDSDRHAKAISKVFNKKKRTETEATVVLAVHLFQELASDVVVCNNMKGLQALNKKCPCECGASFKTGSTGIGAYSVWHGFTDMIVETATEKTVSVPVKVMVNRESEQEELGIEEEEQEQELETEDNEPQSKSPRLETEPQNGSSTIETETTGITVEVKAGEIKTDEVARQMVSQTITNSYAQVNVNKNLSKKFLPSICCSLVGVMIFAYNEEHDILISNKTEMTLFQVKNKDKLNLTAILEIWLALNVHFTGCDAGNFKKLLAKSQFQKLLEPFKEKLDFYKTAGFKLQKFPDYKALNFFETPYYVHDVSPVDCANR